MRIENEYTHGDKVYRLTDEEQYERIVTGIMVRPGGQLVYELTCADMCVSDHYGFEIIKDKRVF